MPKKGGKATPKQLEALRKGREKMCANMKAGRMSASTREVLERSAKLKTEVRQAMAQRQDAKGSPKAATRRPRAARQSAPPPGTYTGPMTRARKAKTE